MNGLFLKDDPTLSETPKGGRAETIISYLNFKKYGKGIVQIATELSGNKSCGKICLNEGSGFSIDDIVVEQQMTYAARSIFPWYCVTQTPFKDGVGTNMLPQT